MKRRARRVWEEKGEVDSGASGFSAYMTQRILAHSKDRSLFRKVDTTFRENKKDLKIEMVLVVKQEIDI